MALTYFVKINNVTLPKLGSYQLEPNRLQADAGRNLQGDLKITYIGRFPKLYLHFVNTTKAEMKLLTGLLEQPSFLVAFYDVMSDTIKSGTFYAGNYKWGLFSKSRELFDPFDVDLVPFGAIS